MDNNIENNTEIKAELNKAISSETEKIIISNPTSKDNKYRRIEIKKLVIKGKEEYQISSYTEKQVFQSNVSSILLAGKIFEVFPNDFLQMNIFNRSCEISLKYTKKGKLLKNVNNKVKTEAVAAGHNREKNYILKEGTVIPPLVDMGVFTSEGKVVQKMYDKFKQINRFIEMVDDVLKDYNKEEIHIIDFGCGKSYLTFIVYYYLVELKHKKAYITGLDLKADVIDKCNKTAKKYKYENLQFKLGDINGYKTDEPVDMVITLHACDTATDYALYNAVKWNASYILSVPCCQHEVNKQIDNKTLAPIMKYGIIKERTAALVTDSVRGCMLEYCGYRTQLLEFVDMAHSPKNILIRAVKSNVSKEKRLRSLDEATEMCKFLNIEPTIVKLLG